MSRLVSAIVATFVFAFSFSCAHAQPATGTLAVSQNAAGEVIATVHGTVPSCGVTVTQPDPHFEISGTTITVTEHLLGISCAKGVPPTKPYDVTLDFGRLRDGTYTIDWSFPELSATYTVFNPRVAITAGMTGSWYDRSVSGQGFELQVLATDPPSLLATWFTFLPQGGPLWVTGTGPIANDTATVQAYQAQGSGAVFPNYLVAPGTTPQLWGTLTFTFIDCNHGVVDYDAPLPYGSGSLSLDRLTLPAGLACP